MGFDASSQNTEIQKYRNTEIQKYRNTEIQKYRNTEIQKYRNTEIQKYRKVLLCSEGLVALSLRLTLSWTAQRA